MASSALTKDVTEKSSPGLDDDKTTGDANSESNLEAALAKDPENALIYSTGIPEDPNEATTGNYKPYRHGKMDDWSDEEKADRRFPLVSQDSFEKYEPASKKPTRASVKSAKSERQECLDTCDALALKQMEGNTTSPGVRQ
ncbi:hypothetical protein BV898_17372 [Hypsibius exemplaris]|uniref:Uncharacterized protein n=1 Tax=Hypsibius exemplaris TaxID=2072580 RepID=A0A9X6NFH4_HYPEX|nr:hypothetical protein BV898_17372 [Hypsibius exemplaris]